MNGSFQRRYQATMLSILWQDTLRFNEKDEFIQGPIGISGQYLFDILNVLARYRYPHYHQLMALNQRYLEMARFTFLGGEGFPLENLRLSVAEYARKTPPTLCGSRSEMHNDQLLLLRLIALMPYLWTIAGNRILSEPRSFHVWQAYVGITHQNLRSFAAGFLFTHWLNFLHHLPLKRTLIQRKKQFRDIVHHSLIELEKHPHFQGQLNHFAQLFAHRTLPILNLERFGETERIKDGYIVHGLINAVSIVLRATSFEHAIASAKKFDRPNGALHAAVAALGAPMFAHSLTKAQIKKVPAWRNFLSAF